MAPKALKIFFLVLLSAFSTLWLFTSCEVQKASKSQDAVSTVNPNYSRIQSKVLIRHITQPTKANLDYSAYHKNVMLYDDAKPEIQIPAKITLTSLTFDGVVTSAKNATTELPLSTGEFTKSMSWTPVQEYLLTWSFEKGAKVAQANSKITGQKWGCQQDVSQPFQEVADIWIHNNAGKMELWVEIEFKNWMQPFIEGITDSDGDGYPEAFGQISSDVATQEILTELKTNYLEKVLNEDQVTEWCNTLASYWYPTKNTDVVDLTGVTAWPFKNTEKNILGELKGAAADDPMCIMKGRPFGLFIYNVFTVAGMGKREAVAAGAGGQKVANRKVDENLPDFLDEIKTKINNELTEYGGGSWDTWVKKLTPFHKITQTLAASQPQDIMGLEGAGKFIVFRRSTDYILAGDPATQPPENNPIPVIIAFKDKLAKMGIDFLFVPVPIKPDLYPEAFKAGIKANPGNIQQPFTRKLMLDLAQNGVETIDLLTPFLEAKDGSEEGDENLYQFQDTHWTQRGIKLAAQVINDRLQSYAWIDEVTASQVEYEILDTIFEHLGDIHPRLPDAAKSKYGPQKLKGEIITSPDGKPYKDNADSPVLIIGDSFTGVYHKVAPKSAGVSAHIAKNLGISVDLIMGWGGGPEAPGKLSKRGDSYLDNKRIVIWIMAARDCFVYKGGPWKVNF